MRITVAAVGRLKRGPERELAARYVERAQKAGRPLGLAFALREVRESRAPDAAGRRRAEADILLAGLPAGAILVALDERGTDLTSRAFAARIAAWRDGGAQDVAIAIGGPDGLDPAVLERADRIAFGRITLPHQLARIVLAEQLYRAVTVLAGHPYHRD